jgi:hypothetical protein
MSKEILETCQQAVERYNKLNKETPLLKEITIPTISFKITQSDEGELIDPDSWEICTVKMAIYPEQKLEGSYLCLRRSHQIDRAFMTIIYRFQWIDGAHGFSVGEIDTSSSSEGIDISVNNKKKISSSEALLIINAKTHWLRQREGTALRLPSIANFRMS